jgi:hypothetical protein
MNGYVEFEEATVEARASALERIHFISQQMSERGRTSHGARAMAIIHSDLSRSKFPLVLTAAEYTDIFSLRAFDQPKYSKELESVLVYCTSKECSQLLKLGSPATPILVSNEADPLGRVTLEICLSFFRTQQEKITVHDHSDQVTQQDMVTADSPPCRDISAAEADARINQEVPMECRFLPCLRTNPWPGCIDGLWDYFILRLSPETNVAGKQDFINGNDLSVRAESMQLATANCSSIARCADFGVIQILTIEQGKVLFLLWSSLDLTALRCWLESDNASPATKPIVIQVLAGDVLIIPAGYVVARFVVETAVVTSCLAWDVRSIHKVPPSISMAIQFPKYTKEAQKAECAAKLHRFAEMWESGSRFWKFPDSSHLPSFKSHLDALEKT